MVMESVETPPSLKWASVQRETAEYVSQSYLGIDEQLFAATKEDELWMCEPFTPDASWEHIGQAENIVAMTAINDRLFIATNDRCL